MPLVLCSWLWVQARTQGGWLRRAESLRRASVVLEVPLDAQEPRSNWEVLDRLKNTSTNPLKSPQTSSLLNVIQYNTSHSIFYQLFMLIKNNK